MAKKVAKAMKKRPPLMKPLLKPKPAVAVAEGVVADAEDAKAKLHGLVKERAPMARTQVQKLQVWKPSPLPKMVGI
jgi:hypothetical protein